MAPDRTQTVPNGGGTHGPRDVVWGSDVKKVVASVLSLLVAILGWSIIDRLTMEHRVTVIERGEFTAAQKQNLKDIVKLAVSDELNEYPTRVEWERSKTDIATKLLASQEETKRELHAIRREFKEDAMYNRRVLSSIDLTNVKGE